jgi:membrane protein CcdC involved in cytochrome C biogenesis
MHRQDIRWYDSVKGTVMFNSGMVSRFHAFLDPEKKSKTILEKAFTFTSSLFFFFWIFVTSGQTLLKKFVLWKTSKFGP